MATAHRRMRERHARIETITSSAEKLFYERGYFDVSMDDIAAAAELAKGSVYYYFRKKAHIIYAILHAGLTRFHEALARAVEAPADPVEKLRALITTHSSFLAENQRLMVLVWRFVNSPQGVLGKRQTEALKSYHRRSMVLIGDVIHAAVRAEKLRPLDPEPVAQLVGGMLMASVVMSAASDRPYDAQAQAELIFEVLMRGIGRPQ